MKLTVLVDNATLVDRYFLGEPGVSYFIEEGDKRVLFDVGYSDAFIRNAKKMSINLLDVDLVVLSHGHLDHTWGLIPLIRLHTEAMIEGMPRKRPTLVAHPLVLSARALNGLPEIGSLISEEKLSSYLEFRLSKEPVYLTEGLVFLGEIQRLNEFEAKEPIGRAAADGNDDFVPDDSALAYMSPGGLVVITGCSHSGICNIVDHARKICREDKVVDIIGGFHLLNCCTKQLQQTVEYMKSLGPTSVHACHCTDLKAKSELSRVVNLEEVGVGLSLEY